MANIIHRVKDGQLPPNVRNETRIPAFIIVIQHCTRRASQINIAIKIINVQIEKKVKVFLFTMM